MRKVSAVLGSLFVMAAAIAVLALPAAADYVPASTTPTSQAAANNAANLAFTGSDSKPLIIIGILAVTMGAVLVVAARRRSTVQAPKVG